MPFSDRRLDRWTRQLRLTQRDRIVAAKTAFRVSDIPVKGTIVITQKHICFCPSLSGLSPSMKITYSELVSVCKERVFSVFPTGIRVTTSKTTVIFSNIGSRDKLLKYVNSAWDAWKSQPAPSRTPSRRGSATAIQPIFRQHSETSFGRRGSVCSETDDTAVTVIVSAVATAAATPADSAAVTDADDDPSDSGIESSPCQPALRLSLPATAAEATPDTGAPRMDDSVAQISGAFSGWFECLGGGGVLAGVLLGICTLVAVWLSIRTVSLQQQLLAITDDRTVLRIPDDQLGKLAMTSMLNAALDNLSTLTIRLSQLSQSLIEAAHREK